MNKNNENKLMPTLRFPEFRDAEHWNEFELGHCLSRHPEYGINAPAVPFSDNLPTYLRITDISEDGYFLRNQMVSVGKKVTEDNYLQEGDIVLARTGASVGKSYKYRIEDGELVFAGFLIRVRPDKKKLDSELLFQFLSTEQYWRWVNFISARSGQPGINGNEYSSMPISLPPSLEEQQKIASCLSSLDEVITAESQKLDILKDHKKGLLQNLLPQEGETVPKLRFKEFEDNGEWEEMTLGDVAEIITGNTPPTNDVSSYSGNKLFVSPADISETRYVVKTKTTLTDKGFALTRHIKENSVLFVCIGSTIGKVAQNKFECATNQQINSLISYEGFSNDFLYSLLDSNSSKIASTAGKHAVPIINKTSFSAVKLRFPPKLVEQQKIASCLSSIDELINAQSQKVETMKLHKKGLLQGLFPTIKNEE